MELFVFLATALTMACPSLPQCDMPEQVCRWLKGWRDETQITDGDALSWFQRHWTFCSPSDLHHFRWQPHLEVNCSSLLLLLLLLELTSCLALCEMYWPSFCPRDDRGFWVFSVCFVISILENNAWRDPLILFTLVQYLPKDRCFVDYRTLESN